ncbi:MAG: sigma-E processing peptidase SpoIIGA [Oscillospiraceae bacterium]
MTVIYIDVLIGLNIYITYFLLLAAESLSKVKSPVWRRGIASSVGGFFSLMILAPDIPFMLLAMIKLLLAAILILLDFGYKARAVFLKRVLIFFGVNFIFAGFMIAVWLIFTPPKLAIRNGTIYYHFSAITLMVSTIAAYGAVRILEQILSRSLRKQQIFIAEVQVDGQQAALSVFLDTGNHACSVSGLPVVFCTASALKDIVPPEILTCMKDIGDLSALNGRRWASRVQIVPYHVIHGKGILAGFQPDSFVLLDHDKKIERNCVLVPVFEPLSDGETNAIAGEALFYD